MSEELFVRQCAPTLAGIKTGNMFRTAYADEQELVSQIREMNQRLREKGLCLLPLRVREGQALLYLYRPQRLALDLQYVREHSVILDPKIMLWTVGRLTGKGSN